MLGVPWHHAPRVALLGGLSIAALGCGASSYWTPADVGPLHRAASAMLSLHSMVITTSYGDGKPVVVTRAYFQAPDRLEILPANGSPGVESIAVDLTTYTADSLRPGYFFVHTGQPVGAAKVYTTTLQLIEKVPQADHHGSSYRLSGRYLRSTTGSDGVTMYVTLAHGRVSGVTIQLPRSERGEFASAIFTYTFSDLNDAPLVLAPSATRLVPTSPVPPPCSTAQTPRLLGTSPSGSPEMSCTPSLPSSVTTVPHH